MYPRENDDFADWKKLIDGFIVANSPKRFFSKSSRFFIQGSCFAENLHEALKDAGYNAYYNKMQEALNSPIANWFYLKDLASKPESPVYQQLATADVFILTIGVAACWYSKKDNGFVYAPDLKRLEEYEQRTMTVDEAREMMHAAIKLIFSINPNIFVALTLSPVPLGRTFEFDSGIVADCVSKSILRSAMFEMLGPKTYSNLLYFPSFEIIRWAGGHRGDAFGDDGGPRHVSRDAVSEIVAAFVRHYSLEAQP
jgi:hypothetical protein